MKLRSSDYLLVRFCHRASRLLQWLGDWESRLLQRELSTIAIDRPVFVTGLARSGSTLLLELLSAVDGVATHRYRDFPFLAAPWLWNQYLDLFPYRQQPVERPHQDRILITRESPEAMEEPIWTGFFPHVHSPTALHGFSASESHPRFERFYQDHLRKILLLRQATRYLAKGNYHLPRLEYLLRIFPDAEFIVPIRHPIAHAHSLVRQHRLFCEHAGRDSRVPQYLTAAGHFEFGPQRVPVRLSSLEGDRIAAAWAEGEDYLGYSIQWKELYGFVRELQTSRPDLAARIHVIRYEDLCDSPEEEFRRLLRCISFEEDSADRAIAALKRVSPSPHVPNLSGSERSSIWEEVRMPAESFGYSPDALAPVVRHEAKFD